MIREGGKPEETENDRGDQMDIDPVDLTAQLYLYLTRTWTNYGVCGYWASWTMRYKILQLPSWLKWFYGSKVSIADKNTVLESFWSMLFDPEKVSFILYYGHELLWGLLRC